jgi:hypothetical protein
LTTRATFVEPVFAPAAEKFSMTTSAAGAGAWSAARAQATTLNVIGTVNAPNRKPRRVLSMSCMTHSSRNQPKVNE